MLANLDRHTFIELLEKLGDENDEIVVSAARDLNAQLVVANLTWDDLLIPENIGDDEEGDDEEGDDEEPDDLETSLEGAVLDEEELGESLNLIKRILELGVSKELTEELEEYKVDIKEGEFDSEDLQYLRALYKRLAK